MKSFSALVLTTIALAFIGIITPGVSIAGKKKFFLPLLIAGIFVLLAEAWFYSIFKERVEDYWVKQVSCRWFMPPDENDCDDKKKEIFENKTIPARKIYFNPKGFIPRIEDILGESDFDGFWLEGRPSIPPEIVRDEKKLWSYVQEKKGSCSPLTAYLSFYPSGTNREEAERRLRYRLNGRKTVTLPFRTLPEPTQQMSISIAASSGIPDSTRCLWAEIKASDPSGYCAAAKKALERYGATNVTQIWQDLESNRQACHCSTTKIASIYSCEVHIAHVCDLIADSVLHLERCM